MFSEFEVICENEAWQGSSEKNFKNVASKMSDHIHMLYRYTNICIMLWEFNIHRNIIQFGTWIRIYTI